MLENAKLYEQDLESDATRSWGATTVIDGTTYATSLFWQPLQNRDDPYTEIEETAESVLEGADLFAFKPGKSIQYGVCASTDGYKRGLPALAVSLSTALGDKSSFVAVFKVDNGWWYCCARNDIILSDGDMLFLKEENAKEQFMSMMTVPDWGRKIAPAEWHIEDTQDPDLASLITNGIKSKLQKIKAMRGPKLYAIVAVSAIVGFWLISTLITDVIFAPKRKPVVVAPVKPKVVKQIEEKPIVMPWTTIKNPKLVLEYCYKDVMQLVKIMPPGWSIGGITCTANGVTASWRREVGRIAWVDKALKESGISFVSKSISPDGNVLIASTSYPAKVISSPPAYKGVELKNILNDLFQSLDVKIILQEVSEMLNKEKKGGFIGGPKQKPTIYRMVKFSFEGTQNPIIWRDILTKFSGLTIDNIKYDNVLGIWYYEGAIYVM